MRNKKSIKDENTTMLVAVLREQSKGLKRQQVLYFYIDVNFVFHCSHRKDLYS